MKPKIIAWNVRGLNAFKKRLRIRGLLKEWKADVVCLIETKMGVITREVVQSLWRGQHVDWFYKRAVGASGGMLLMWDRRVVEKREDCMGSYMLACSFKNVEDHFEWVFWSGVWTKWRCGEERPLGGVGWFDESVGGSMVYRG